jgi:predicted nucleic acid-binding protein
VFYLDTSALTKLVVREAESPALVAWWSANPAPKIASELVRAELFRAVARTLPDRLFVAETILDRLTLISVSRSVLDRAGRLQPAVLRTLDAIHLATALEVDSDLDGFVAYDQRLAASAAALGLTVVAPTLFD